MEEPEWRELSPDQAGTVERLAREIWPVVYADLLRREQIDYMLDWMYSPEKLRGEIESGGIVYLLIRSGGKTCGFTAFGPLEADAVCHLHKLYVAPGSQGKGFGQRTIGEIAKRSRSAGARAIELRVNRNNRPAIGLYRKCGFVVAGEDCADIGGGFVMDDYIFRKELP